jgi:FAD synthetase
MLKRQGLKIVLAGGCFDILHVGHIEFLNRARKQGDVLLLLLESDKAITQLKGDSRPLNSQNHRARVLSALENVDYIILLPEPYETEDYRSIVNTIKPDIIAVTSGDPNMAEKKSQAREVGGRVRVVLKKIPEHSTTKILGYF